MKNKHFRIGFISKLNGFKGEVIFIPENIDVKMLKKQKFIFVDLDGIKVPFGIEEVFEKSGKAALKLTDVNDGEYAKRLLTRSVYIDAKVKPKKKEESSGNELIGYEIIDSSHGVVGIIEKVEEYPQQLIATCIVNSKEVLIPLNEEFLKEVDDEEQKVYLTLPEGLLDIYL